MIKLGIVGLSEGNGHPYSWSAIFNGYQEAGMRSCPFPVIPSYLSEQKFPEEQIQNAKVTHIWTQDLEISKHVARATNIQNICMKLTDMVSQVDAVLLARDDAENHYEMAEIFLKRGLPIFIDKPLAYSLREANRILSLEQYQGQLFTCSGLKFSKDLELTDKQKNSIGRIKSFEARVPKDWKKYSIHMIDPVLNYFSKIEKIKSSARQIAGDKTTLNVTWESGLTASFTSFGHEPSPIQITIIGEKSHQTLTFKNTFQAFKSSLEVFVSSVQKRSREIPLAHTLAAIELIEKGVGE